MKIENIRKAAKNYRCNFCGDKILKGDGYRKLTLTPWDYRDNEGFSTIRTHLDCVRCEKFFYCEDEGVYIYDECFSEFKKYKAIEERKE